MPTLTRGSAGTTFFTAPYRPNDHASPRGHRQHADRDHRDGQGRELRAVEPFAKEQQPQRDSDQRIDEIAEGGVHHVAVVDGVDIDHPVHRDQRRRGRQQQPGASRHRPEVAEPPYHGDHHDHQREAPHNPVGQDFECASGFEQGEERRKQPPHRVGANAEQQP
jgi:hypothetical protein